MVGSGSVGLEFGFGFGVYIAFGSFVVFYGFGG